MEQVTIEIDCPDCGYNYYNAIDKTTNQECYLTIGKCRIGKCDMTVDGVSDVSEEFAFESFSELKDFAYANYTILGKEDCGCTN